jgi:hypothetical protein
MISISIKVQIPDFDRISTEVPCPRCGLHTWVKLGEIRRRDFAICRGCHANILLEDHLGGVQRFIRDTERTLEALGR